MDPGFLELKTAQQLFEKLEDDFRISMADPLDSRKWFNFFVTAEHLPEWLLGSQSEAFKFRQSKAILRVCSHIANGGKHFIVTQHKAIGSTGITFVTIFDPKGDTGFVSEQPNQNQAFTLFLSEDDAKELGSEILVSELAERVLVLYRTEIQNSVLR